MPPVKKNAEDDDQDINEKIKYENYSMTGHVIVHSNGHVITM